MADAVTAPRELWGWRDSRTGTTVSNSVCHTREYAEQTLQGWRDRDARGKRPDLHDLMPFVEVYQLVGAEGIEPPTTSL